MGRYTAQSAFTACLLAGCSSIEPLQLNSLPENAGPIRADVREFDHRPFDRLLRTHVTAGGLVDYDGLLAERDKLIAYLEDYATVDPAGLADDDERKAYWINAYNSITLAGILNFYPGVASIRDLGGFWDVVTTNCGGRVVSLNDIEHRILRELGDPRIHMAINCASTSCPRLLDRAYRGEELDAQLDEVSRGFLVDDQRNAFDDERQVARLSKIFSWFGGDFAVAPYGGVRGFVRAHGPSRPWLEEEFEITYRAYDWSLNAD